MKASKIEINRTEKLDKYKQNLSIVNNCIVKCYESLIGLISSDELLINEDYIGYSSTTTKHINYVGREYGLTIRIVNKSEFENLINNL